MLDEVARATDLREGAAGVEALVREVNRTPNIRLADAARGARLPLPVASAIRRELEKRGLFGRENGLTLTESGKQWTTQNLGMGEPLSLDVPLMPKEHLDEPLRQVELALEALRGSMPQADVKLDQAPCTSETAVRRAALLYQIGGLEGRRIVLVGDDDCVSLACALFETMIAKRRLARRITVVDTDQRFLKFIHDQAVERNLPIDVVEHNLRNPLPNALLGKFDTFITDPPYTHEGARLFLSRGVECLERGQGIGLFSFRHSAPSQRIQLQSSLAEIGLGVTALYPDFNRYGGAAILGSYSELCQLVVHARPGAGEHWNGALYTADVNPKTVRYACTKCKTEVTLGAAGIPDTIGMLKLRGCSKCGNAAFSRH
jgi:predicted methyltransferase